MCPYFRVSGISWSSLAFSPSLYFFLSPSSILSSSPSSFLEIFFLLPRIPCVTPSLVLHSHPPSFTLFLPYSPLLPISRTLFPSLSSLLFHPNFLPPSPLISRSNFLSFLHCLLSLSRSSTYPTSSSPYFLHARTT